MVTKRKGARAKRKIAIDTNQLDTGSPTLPVADTGAEATGVETTGRFICMLKQEAAADPAATRSALNQLAGLREVAASDDFEGGAISGEDLADNDVVHFYKLGIVVVTGEEAVQALAASASDADSAILAIEPEYVAYPSGPANGGLPLEYLSGYKDAVNHLYDHLSTRGAGLGEEAEISAVLQDTSQFTWGLQATRVSTSQRNGQGIKVAVLDTGFDFQHPDFQGRAIVSRSFVSGVTVQDIFGHGTHCIGTACGPQRPATGVRRYGIAFGSQIFVGKVFNNAQPRPGAPTSSVVAGIEWALTNGCRVASLSLGVPIDQKIMQYDVPVRRALNAGLLVVAAAGNNANRPGNPGFVEPPANADAALAVSAIDNRLQIARFSSRSSQLIGVGGLVNIAGPGVAVFSSVPVVEAGMPSLTGPAWRPRTLPGSRRSGPKPQGSRVSRSGIDFSRLSARLVSRRETLGRAWSRRRSN